MGVNLSEADAGALLAVLDRVEVLGAYESNPAVAFINMRPSNGRPFATSTTLAETCASEFVSWYADVQRVRDQLRERLQGPPTEEWHKPSNLCKPTGSP